jgi:hypothetical protein
MITPRTLLALCALGLAHPALAQRNNASDATGVGLTGSTAVGAVFAPTVARVEVPIADAGNVSAPMQVRLSVSVTSLQQRLEAGALTSLNGIAAPAAIQQQLRALFSPTTRSEVLVQLQADLARGVPNQPALAARLAEALSDVAAFATPRNVALAIDRFNALVADAEPSYLRAMPPVLSGVHAMLQTLGAGASGTATTR